MQFILVVDRKHLFPELFPQGFLPLDSVDLAEVERRSFFAEREFMERCSHFKQIIPYIALTLGDEVLCYQRRAKHTEKRLGGLWTVGFGGHIEPIDRDEAGSLGVVKTTALRELEEETGLKVDGRALEPLGFINSDREEVSQVHFGVVFRVRLDDRARGRDEIAALISSQSEPHRVEWRTRAELHPREEAPPAPHGGRWEDWTRYVLEGKALLD